MGDRGNIVIRQQANTNRGDVWFYGHWSGYHLKEIVQNALAKHWRWTDYSYLARIVFDEMSKGHQGEEHSFGISTTIGDNEYPILVVDCPGQKVYEVPEASLIDFRLPNKPKAGKSWTFQEFADLAKKPADKSAVA